MAGPGTGVPGVSASGPRAGLAEAAVQPPGVRQGARGHTAPTQSTPRGAPVLESLCCFRTRN